MVSKINRNTKSPIWAIGSAVCVHLDMSCALGSNQGSIGSHIRQGAAIAQCTVIICVSINYLYLYDQVDGCDIMTLNSF